MATVDPITVEVIGNALSSIVDEMGETLVRAAYSTNVKERRDTSTCLFDVRGRTLCQAMHIPMHLGSLMGVIEHVTARHPLAEIREGDVFVGNDAYTGGGTHLPDIVMVEPVFLDGDVVAWATNIAHHADFVDRAHAHIYQEGLRIPPVRLHRAGAIQQDVLDLILLNCQVPRERLNDLRAQMAANRQGIQRFQSLCRRYGKDLVLAACEALLDYTERMTRAGIRTIPSGVYEFEDRFDTDEIPDEKIFTTRIEVKGDEMFLRFESPPQVRAGLNLVWTGLLATVYYAVKTLIGPEIPANAGLFRPIHVSAPPGRMLNCVAPAAVNSRTQTCQRVVDLIHGALARAIPRSHHRRVQRRLRVVDVQRRQSAHGTVLRVSGNDPRRVRRTRDEERPRRRARAHHEHVEPSGGGARAGISARRRAARVGRRFRRAGEMARRSRHRLPNPRRGSRLPRVRARRATALGAVGIVRRPRGRTVSFGL